MKIRFLAFGVFATILIFSYFSIYQENAGGSSMDRLPQSETPPRDWAKEADEYMAEELRNRPQMSASEEKEFYNDSNRYMPELLYHLRLKNFSEAEKLLSVYDVWNHKITSAKNEVTFVHNIGDELVMTIGLEELKTLQSLGFDPRLANDEVLKRVSTYPGYSKDTDEMRRLFGNRLEPFWGTKQPPASVVSGDKNTSGTGSRSVLDEIKEELLLEDLADLVKISPCFESLAKSDLEASDFCTGIYNLFTIDIPSNERSERVKFNGEKGLFGMCEVEPHVILENKEILYSYPGAPSDLGRSEVTIVPYKKVASGRTFRRRADSSNSKKIPLYSFFKAASKFCKAIVITVDSDEPDKKGIFNQYNSDFIERFRLPPGFEKEGVELGKSPQKAAQ